MLERLRGAASATEPRTQRAIYEMGLSVMNPVLRLLEVYKHEVLFIACILYSLLHMVHVTQPVFKIHVFYCSVCSNLSTT